jgi:MFS family permease
MRIIPPQLRGRALALLRMLIQSGNPIGGAVAGALAPAVGLLWLIGLAALIVGLPGVLGQGVPALRQAGAPIPAEPAPPRTLGSTVEEEAQT